jgi:ubiquinone/menaquinone biosynthesis C-methylase UbiE
MMNTSCVTNADARQDWNGALGEIWIRQQALFDRVLAPAGEAAIARAHIRSGEKVIDVGCGCGATTAAIAELVGSTGEVFAVDISEPMLAEAKRRMGNDRRVSFANADAATHPFRTSYCDILFSRFGVMFFDYPAVAFANMRKALRPGGRLSFACFREAAKNTYVMLPLAAAYKHVPPLPSPTPNASGMFSFADENRVRGILATAGFNAIRLEPIDAKLDIAVGGGLDTAVSVAMELGPIGRAMQGKSAEERSAVSKSVRQALAAYQDGDRVPLDAAWWMVTARNP